ncbi:hypothetical protein VoSk93_05440 [Vibrio owensii]
MKNETITQLIIRRPSKLATHYCTELKAFCSVDGSESNKHYWFWCSVNLEWIKARNCDESTLIHLDESKALTESQTVFLQQAKQALDETFNKRGLDFDKQSRAIKIKAYEQQFENMEAKYTEAQLNHMYPKLDLFELNHFIKATV